MRGREGESDRQFELLKHADEGVRYWAAMGLHATASAEGLSDPTARAVLQVLRQETSPTVRIELAAALAAIEPPDTALLLQEQLDHNWPDVVLHAMRTVELLGERARPLLSKMREMHQRAQASKQPGDMSMFIRFSRKAAIEQLEASTP